MSQQFFLGVGLSWQQQDVSNVAAHIITCLKRAGISQIEGVATRVDRASHPLVRHLASIFSARIFTFSVADLEAQTFRLANPSSRLYARIGCHGVAEAAALASVGVMAHLVIEKTTYQSVSFAVAQTGVKEITD